VQEIFIKKNGFFEVGIRPKYYMETNEDAIMMTLELPDTGRPEPRQI